MYTLENEVPQWLGIVCQGRKEHLALVMENTVTENACKHMKHQWVEAPAAERKSGG